MKKRLLPVPLILLIPILLLIIVVVAGLYRFSMSDQEILDKFPRTQQNQDEVLKSVFGISTPNPWTIEVPNSHAYSFIETNDAASEVVTGRYDAGSERGNITIFTKWMLPVNSTDYVSVMSVSNQGSGVFYYLTRFHYDEALKRMITRESHLLGDRIKVEAISLTDNVLDVSFYAHSEGQAMADVPTSKSTLKFELANSGVLRLLE
ncbi:hypothetical protein [Vibrio japonicus]|uniref:Uncharacterized protein n=1 Tax=Vibrio japonicus TaxID=1824638 RepID=A0ABY5LLW2_9VIBR|nr:hypothetical protein [Vibrio japonicus]UUM33074.1 hypothetical protein NP165_16130 [Vibrio japonicus]